MSLLFMQKYVSTISFDEYLKAMKNPLVCFLLILKKKEKNNSSLFEPTYFSIDLKENGGQIEIAAMSKLYR